MISFTNVFKHHQERLIAYTSSERTTAWKEDKPIYTETCL